jgi:hypothetical protein
VRGSLTCNRGVRVLIVGLAFDWCGGLVIQDGCMISLYLSQESQVGVNLITLGTRTTLCLREYVISTEEVSTLHLTTFTEVA